MKSVPGQFEFFPHTADAKFRAYGATPEEAFRNAGKAMTAIITDGEIKPKKKFPIELRAKRLDSLLFDFLDRLLFLLDTEDFLFSDCTDMRIIEEKGKIEPKKDGEEKVGKRKGGNGLFVLKGTVSGDSYKSYETHGDVKAVTYNDMELKEEKGRWTAQVVVDL
jgi:SHS2 domain-containing protein